MEAEMGLTQMAFEGATGRHKDDSSLLVKFYNHPKMDSVRSKEEGRPIYKEVPYIQIMTPGNKDSIIVRPATDMDKRRFPEHFRKFQARSTEDHVEGTRLEEWPAVTRSQVEELKFFNIQTVEQLAGAPDSNIQGIMGVGLLKQKAKTYLEASGTQKAAEELRQARDEIENLKAVVAELAAKVPEDDEAAPKRRGRPPKSAD